MLHQHNALPTTRGDAAVSETAAGTVPSLLNMPDTHAGNDDDFDGGGSSSFVQAAADASAQTTQDSSANCVPPMSDSNTSSEDSSYPPVSSSALTVEITNTRRGLDISGASSGAASSGVASSTSALIPATIDETTEEANAGTVLSANTSIGATRDVFPNEEDIPAQSSLFATDSDTLEGNDNTTTNTDNLWRKERPTSTSAHTDESEIGAQQVDEPAPQLNRRFFRGLARRNTLQRSRERERRARRRQGLENSATITLPTQEELMTASVRPMQGSVFSSISSSGVHQDVHDSGNTRDSFVRRFSKILLSATLVEEEPPMKVAVAEPMSFLQRRWKILVAGGCLLLIIITVLLSVFLTAMMRDNSTNMPTTVPSSAPSSSPSFDPRPTLAIVQERGYVRCGLFQKKTEARNFRRDLVSLRYCLHMDTAEHIFLPLISVFFITVPFCGSGGFIGSR